MWQSRSPVNFENENIENTCLAFLGRTDGARSTCRYRFAAQNHRPESHRATGDNEQSRRAGRVRPRRLFPFGSFGQDDWPVGQVGCRRHKRPARLAVKSRHHLQFRHHQSAAIHNNKSDSQSFIQPSRAGRRQAGRRAKKCQCNRRGAALNNFASNSGVP